jgi:hypothetical protein
MLRGGMNPPFYSTFRRARCAPEPSPRPIAPIPKSASEHTIGLIAHFDKSYYAAIRAAIKPAVPVSPMDPTINPAAPPTVSPDDGSGESPGSVVGPNLLSPGE